MMKLKPQPKTSSASDSGFTIIESLLGIVVVAILLAGISPVLVMSTATRVQSRRTEKATQAANTFIDGVRTGSIAEPVLVDGGALAQVTAAQPRTLADNLITGAKMQPPGSATDADLYFVRSNGTVCKPFGTGTCIKDPNNPFDEFFIQARQIRVQGSGENDGFRLALRVYRGDVDFSKNLLASDANNKKTSSLIAAGLGNRQAPAIERTIDISNIRTSFGALCQRFGTQNAQGCN
jgi:prepilin-type N-terminal cleavage/methylation domain-containing protein